MTVDPLGLTIFLIGIAFLIIELANPGYFFGVPGTTGVIIGLIQIAFPQFITGTVWSPWVVGVVAVGSFFLSMEFYRRFAPAVKPPETLSSDALLGKSGTVTARVQPGNLQGKVKIGGIVWSATSDEPIDEGRTVVVRKVEGVHLEVAPSNGVAPAAPSPVA